MGSSFVRLLGAVCFVDQRGDVVELPSPSQRRLLATLALANGSTLRSEHLCEALDLTTGSLRTTVSRLRSRLGDSLISTESAGYRITCAVDATMFADLIAAHRDQDDPLEELERALALWSGEALDEFRHEPWAAPEAARLDELRALAVEDRAELLITRGRPDEAVAALEPHIAANPLRDRPRGLLIQALAANGRQADALRAYQSYRELLAEETGTDPSDLVRSIERRVATGWVDDDRDDDTPSPVRRRAARAFEVPLPGELAAAPAPIGRRHTLDWLDSELMAARSGSLRIALVGGEQGIGKTTTLAAVARRHLDCGSVVVFGRCAEGADVPLEPFRTIVGQLVQHAPLDLLREHAERCGGELQRVAPRLADRLWIPPPVPSDPATERLRLFEAISDLLKRVASTRSLTLLLDDLHWAEPTALLLLRHLCRTLADAPVLVVAGHRDAAANSTAELRAALAELGRGHCRSTSLRGFDDDELARLVQSVVGADAEPSPEVVAHLRDETAGNPLFALQLVRHLWETELLAIGEGSISFTDEPPGRLSRNLLDVVWSRVGSLGERTAEVLTTASVLGVEFTDEALAAMTELSDREVDDALDEALAANLLLDTGDADRPLRFVHALVANALYAELPARRRRRLHGRAVQVLQRGGRARRADVVVDLARHAYLAGDLTAAQRWSVTAGEQALADLAPAEAARWFELALTYADERCVTDAERAEIESRLGEAQHRCGDPRARQTLLRAAATARKAGVVDVIVRVALANDRGFSSPRVPDVEQHELLDVAIASVGTTDTATLARLLALRAQELVHTPEHELRLSSARRAIELLERSDDPQLLPQMASALAFGLWGPDTFALRRDLAVRAVLATDQLDDPFLEFRTRRAAYYVGVESADPDLARTSLDRVRTIASEVGEPRMRWICEALEAFEAMMEARLEDAERHSERMLELGTEIGEPDAFALYAAQLFVMRSFAGRYAEMIPLLETALTETPDAMAYRIAHAISCAVSGREQEALEVLLDGLAARFDAVPVDWPWMTTVIGYAVLAIELEHAEAAAALLPIIEPYADQVAFTGGTSQGHVGAYVGKLASLLGEHDTADAHLRRSLEIDVACGWRYHEATTLVALALSRRRRTGTLDTQGLGWLDDAAAIADERGLSIVTRQVERLRASLGGDARL